MKYMGLNDVRESYLKFFESKGHLRLPSFSLVPKNDKSLLLINAGMAPLKPYFTGLKVPPRNRVTTCQKCIRTGDIENVGKTSRHGTFFEMLGNFSFGDYFKEEVIPWAWEFVTEVLQIPQEKLFVTIYENDDEAYKIWTEKTNVDPKKVFRLGKEDNFWEIGEGPCGPCSEIHFNKGNVDVNTVEEFIKASDEDKIIEFWNLVFTQYDKDGNGNYNKLKNPNIDTGMGLERIATIMQEVDNIFEIDTIKSISEEVCKIANVSYGKEDKKDVSIRIISDHIRSIAFMISDGILPSNEGRGYVLRRLLRRAERHGKLLGINEMFLYELCDKVIENSKYAYPELKEKEEYIKKVIRLEEERFSETIDSGMEILKSYIKEAKKSNKNVLEGQKAFKLYDTYGFPYELTEEILEDEGLALDKEGFNKEMELQRERARNARQQTNYMGTENNIANEIPKEINTNFVGYDNTEYKSKVSLLIKEDKFVDSLDKEGIIITNETPFYAEMGGQVGDKGIIYNDNFKAEVVDCKNNVSGKIMHFVKVLEGKASKGEEVILKVDEENREKICKNHTATHMLHSALREVLGEHVQQSGSLVNSNRLRFDFTHFASMTEDEIKKVEKIINLKIMKVYSLETKIMTIEEAKQSGATALFDDKYSNQVRVVSISDFSKELCGGTHVKNIGQIGLFKILSESGVAAGIRRIEAVTGEAAIEYVEKNQELIKSIEDVLKTNSKDIINKINLQNSELKDKEKEIEQLKKKIAGGSKEEILNNVKEVNGIKIALGEVKDLDANSLRDLADTIKDSIGSGLVILASNNKDKVQFVAMCTKDVLNKGIHCGKIIKQVSKIAEGGGGGKPDMAQAGGKNPQKIKEALSEVQNIVNKL